MYASSLLTVLAVAASCLTGAAASPAYPARGMPLEVDPTTTVAAPTATESVHTLPAGTDHPMACGVPADCSCNGGLTPTCNQPGDFSIAKRNAGTCACMPA